MLKLIFQFITESYALHENPVDNNILMALVGSIAFFTAWKIVGSLYNGGIISGSNEGKLAHWIIRTFVFIGIYYIFAILIRIYKWILCVPKYVWIILTVVIIVILISILILKYLNKRKQIKVNNIIKKGRIV